MSEETKPDAGTADTGHKDVPVIQTPATAEADAEAAAAAERDKAAAAAQDAEVTRAAHLQTARDSYAGGAPLADCVAWLRLQGHDAYKDAEAAIAAITAM